jgi:plastocyanin
VTTPTSDRPRAIRWLVAGACVLILAGCGSDDGAQTPATEPTGDQADATEEPDVTEAPAEADAAADRDAGAEVLLLDDDGFVFEPAEVTVAAGDTVTWVHDGRISHTVTGDGFASGTLAAGDTFETTFEEPGSFGYVCDFHGSMRGAVTVE